MSIKKYFSCLVVMLAMFAVLMKRANAQATIIEKGASRASIYHETNAAEAVNRAASELQEHLKLMTGVTVPITTDLAQAKGYVIYLGDTAFARKNGIETAKLPPDGYRILSNKNWMVIAGPDYVGPIMTGFENPYRLNESYNPKLKISAFGNAGTLFGVYHLLERYGVRWYMPGPLGTVLPKLDKVTVPALNLTNHPVFEHRHPYYGFMERSDDDTLWYRRAGFGTPAPIAVNHSFGHYFGKYKDTNPEFFALIDGKRDFTNLSSAAVDGNLNLSDPGLLRQAIADINEYFTKNPEQKIFSLCPPDGMQRISDDPVSQAQIDETRGYSGKFSNYVWGFINKVAIEVRKTHPDKLIGCIAYSNYQLPPSNIEKLSPNVAVVICKLRAMYPDAEIKARNEKAVADWNRKASVIYIWEYYCNGLFNPSWENYPMFFSGMLQNDLKSLKGISRGEFIEAESWQVEDYQAKPERVKINYPGLQHPLLYLTARLLWNPDQDADALLGEYYKLFYGPAEKPMRGFWELVESNWMKKGWHTSPNQTYDGETIAKLLAYLREAQEKTATGTDYRGRVDLILSEFGPAAEIAQRLSTLEETATDAQRVPTGATDNPLAGAPLLQFIDRTYQTSNPATNLRLGWDDRNMYVDIACYEPAMDKVKAKATERDSNVPPIWEDDSIEFFLSPDAADPYKSYHYIVNANGTLFDGHYTAKSTIEKQDWTGNAVVTVRKEASRWTVRVVIPWSDLGVVNPVAGMKLKANFYRNRMATGQWEQASWAPMLDGNYYSPPNFGTVTLGAQEIAAVAPLPTALKPGGVKDYGSGAPLKGLYDDGGVPNVGVFIGQPNTQVRNDRALARFDLRSLLESGERLEKAELVFYPQYVVGKLAERTITVDHLNRPVAVLGVDSISTNEAEEVGTYVARRATATAQAAAENGQPEAARLDVTALIRKDLASGHVSTTFRWKDGLAEKEGNPDLQPAGVVIDVERATIPTLVLTWQTTDAS